MNVLLVQLDGALPNLALMRIAAYDRSRGDTVQLARTVHGRSLFESFDRV